MAAEIKPVGNTNTPSHKSLTAEKPVLTSKIDSNSDEILGVKVLSAGKSVLSISNDKSVRMWQQRASGQFWPSICHFLPAIPTSLDYRNQSRTLCLGLSNGTVMEFEVAADENSLNHRRDYLSHQGRVSGVHYSAHHSWVLSISKDKFFCYHSSATGHRLGGYECPGPCSSFVFDELSCHVFVGDVNGAISMLKLESGSCNLITTLNGHSNTVSCLSWDADSQQLFSGSFDSTVMVWDVGGGKGTAYELTGHSGKVRCLHHSASHGILVSGGEDGLLVWWDMTANRLPTPEWQESDSCQYCERPFYWNVKAMINQKQFGIRQHHCRKCGKAVCDSCSSKRTNLPVMGFEFNVRVCEKCYSTVTEKDQESLAVFHEAKHNITDMDLDLPNGVLITVGTDYVIKLWDIKPMLV